MNKVISLFRIAVLIALGFFAMLFIFGEEQESTILPWELCVPIDKTLGVCACLLIARLYRRWARTDPWFIAYDRKCDEETDKL